MFSAVSKMKRGSNQVNPTPSEGKNRPPLKNVTNLSNSGKLQPPNEKETRKIVTRSASKHISVAVNSENALKIRRDCNCLIPTKKPEEKPLVSHKTAAQNKGAVKKSTIAGQCTQTNSKPPFFTESSFQSYCALFESKPVTNKLSSRSREVNYNCKFVPQCSSTLVHSEHDKNEILNSDLSTRLIPKNESTVFKSLSTFKSYVSSGNKLIKPTAASEPKFDPIETAIINFYKKGYTNPYIENKYYYGKVNIHPDFYRAFLEKNMQLPHINFRPQYDKNHPFQNISPILPNELTPLATIIHSSPSGDSLELFIELKKKHAYKKPINTKLMRRDSRIQDLLNTEDLYTLEETKLNGLNILDVRSEIISWLYKVKFFYVQNTSIIFKTIKLYDWVVAHEIIPYNMHELIVITILMIVQKMDNLRICDQSFTIRQISSLCKRAFDPDTVDAMEKKLLVLFNYKVDVPEPVTFLDYLCHNLQLGPFIFSTAEFVLEIFSINKMFSCISPFLAAITVLNLVLPVLAPSFYEQSWSHVLNTFTFISKSQMDFVGNIMREETKNNSNQDMKDTLFAFNQDITKLEIIKALFNMF